MWETKPDVPYCAFCKQELKPGEPVTYNSSFGQQYPSHVSCGHQLSKKIGNTVFKGCGVVIGIFILLAIIGAICGS